MYFYDAKLKFRIGARISLHASNTIVYMSSYRLKFECMNNIVEYEFMVLKLLKVIKIKVEFLIVKGDSKLVINQVRYLCTIKNLRLRNYRRKI